MTDYLSCLLMKNCSMVSNGNLAVDYTILPNYSQVYGSVAGLGLSLNVVHVTSTLCAKISKQSKVCAIFRVATDMIMLLVVVHTLLSKHPGISDKTEHFLRNFFFFSGLYSSMLSTLLMTINRALLLGLDIEYGAIITWKKLLSSSFIAFLASCSISFSTCYQCLHQKCNLDSGLWTPSDLGRFQFSAIYIYACGIVLFLLVGYIIRGPTAVVYFAVSRNRAIHYSIRHTIAVVISSSYYGATSLPLALLFLRLGHFSEAPLTSLIINTMFLSNSILNPVIHFLAVREQLQDLFHLCNRKLRPIIEIETLPS